MLGNCRCCKALAAQVAYSNTWCGAKSWVLAAQPMLQQQYLRSCQLLHIHSLTSPPRGGAAAQATPKRACRVAAEAAGAASSAAARIGGSSSTALVDWVIKKGGSVNGVTMADLSGSDGGSGWGLVATQVSALQQHMQYSTLKCRYNRHVPSYNGCVKLV
eukprot:GHRR01019235.1.p1 GENE.GHRR01019235.1~~GHRR01019235.1.p1  ORF type:complete len:160 (-),score=47.60 GHRR01019235.1:1503-1982(-)